MFSSIDIFDLLLQYCKRFSITYTLNASDYTDRFIQIFRLIHIFKNKITFLCVFDRAIVLRSFTSYSVVFYWVCYFRRIMSRQLSLTSSLQRKDILAQSFFKVVKLSFWFFSKFNFRFLQLSQIELAFFTTKRDFGLMLIGKFISISNITIVCLIVKLMEN